MVEKSVYDFWFTKKGINETGSLSFLWKSIIIHFYFYFPETSGRNIRPLSCQHRESGQLGVCMFAWDCMKVGHSRLLQIYSSKKKKELLYSLLAFKIYRPMERILVLVLTASTLEAVVTSGTEPSKS